MKRQLLILVAAASLLVVSAKAQAQLPGYSFEAIVPPNGPDGFFGLGATVSQDTIGATDLLSSLKYEVGAGGFVGARTEVVAPALNNPAGTVAVLFDITLPVAYPDTFANMGVTLFGHALNPGGPGTFGNQVQFADELLMAPLGAGTHLNQRIDLDVSVGPFRPGASFSDLFGLDANDLSVISAFQFYINKNASTPITVYIDNVRFVAVPEPASMGMAGLAGIALIAVRRRASRLA